MLRGGVNDLGGTLMEETISRMAGSSHGSRKTVAELAEIATGMGRTARQRSTGYGPVSAERQEAARRADARLPLPIVG
jgi:FO synthase